MLEKNNTERILDVFFDYPAKEFHIRELARKSRISAPTVLLAVNRLLKCNIVEVRKKGNMKIVKAAGTLEFLRAKRMGNIEHLYESGLVDYLNDLYDKPKAVILFGSFSRGDDTEKSDIDIAVITTHHKDPRLDAFEKKLNRKISVHEVDIKRMSREFYSNLINGVVMEGAI